MLFYLDPRDANQMIVQILPIIMHNVVCYPATSYVFSIMVINIFLKGETVK